MLSILLFKMSYYRKGNTNSVAKATTTQPTIGEPTIGEPTIGEPTNSADCRILLKRISNDDAQQARKLEEIQTKITTLNDELIKIQTEIQSLNTNKTSIESQQSQNKINTNFLSKLLTKLEDIDKDNIYINRCKDLINTYKWTNVNKDDDDGNDSLKTIPHDIFDFLELQFAPIDSYTSDEIKRIAHYLKATELVYNYYKCETTTYGELIADSYDYEYERYIIGDIRYNNVSYTPIPYATVICDFENITLDDTKIIYDNTCIK
jgi:hypothetical protein